MMKCSSSVVSLVNDGERLLDMGSLPFSLSHITEEDSSIFLFIFFLSHLEDEACTRKEEKNNQSLLAKKVLENKNNSKTGRQS